MKNRPLVKSMLSLLCLSIIVKIVATIAKVTTTRVVGVEATGIFMMINPSMIFLINITQLSLPVVIAKLISSKKETKKVILTTSIILFTITIISMIIILLVSQSFTTNILKNKDCINAFNALALLIPLISIGSIIKGYLIGTNRVNITTASQISEEIGRLVFILALGNSFTNISIPYAASCCVYSLCFGEVCSLTHMIIILLKNKNEKLLSFKNEICNKENYIVKEVLSISLPLTSSKLVTSFTYFLEPIILTFLLLKYGYSISWITKEYGILNGYAMPLIMMPAFFSSLYGKILLPEMTKLNSNNNYKKSFNLFKKFLFITLLTGIFFSLFIVFLRNPLVTILYGSKRGIKYILYLAIPFSIYYLEAPISAAMTSLSLNKETFKLGIYSSFIRLISLVILLEHFNIMAVAISELLGILLYVSLGLYYILRKFSSNNIHTIFFK